MIRDIKLNAGDTKILSLGILTQEKVPINLNDSVIKFQMARRIDTEVLVSKSNMDGIAITDALNGLFEITLLPVDTDSLGGKSYYYEVEVTLQDGTVSTIVSGEIDIQKTLIRSV